MAGRPARRGLIALTRLVIACAAMLAGVQTAPARASNCPGAPAASYGSYDLGPAFDGLSKATTSELCQEGAPDGSVAPGAAAHARGTTAPTRSTAFRSTVYGTCGSGPPSLENCSIALDIQSWPECRRNETSYSTGPVDNVLDPITPIRLRAAPKLPAASFEDGTRIELYTGSSTIVVFGNDAHDVRRAVARLLHRYPRLRSLTKKAGQALLSAAENPALRCDGRRSGKRTLLPRPRAAVLLSGFTRKVDEHAQSANSCTRSVSPTIDPINVVWSGRTASDSLIAEYLEEWGDWDDDQDEIIPAFADRQRVFVRTGCPEDGAQRSDGFVAFNRDHIRLFEFAAGTERFVVGDAHRDVAHIVPEAGCGGLSHSAGSFDGPRDLIAAFSQTHLRGDHLAFWGNTRRMRQCDYTTPFSDGYVLEAHV
jgi:hypothetical protein